MPFPALPPLLLGGGLGGLALLLQRFGQAGMRSA